MSWHNHFPKQFARHPNTARLTLCVHLPQKERAFEIKADVPGVDKKDIKLSVDGDVLSLSVQKTQSKEVRGCYPCCTLTEAWRLCLLDVLGVGVGAVPCQEASGGMSAVSALALLLQVSAVASQDC
jgi:Hsp20/alpha crystallin family